MTQTAPTLSDLYLDDETAWCDAMVELLDLGRHEALDYANLRELLNDMSLRERREVVSRLRVLLTHVLKWSYQPDKRSRSWHLTILEQRDEVADRAASGVLRGHARRAVSDAYADAVERAVVETGLPAEAFPAACPFTLEQLLSFDPAAADI